MKPSHKEIAAILREYAEWADANIYEVPIMLPDDLSEEFSPLFFKEERDAELWRLIKAADKLSAYIKCIEERKAGNCEFEDAERTIRKALDESECREAHIFLEEFIPAYELPLDKLK